MSCCPTRGVSFDRLNQRQLMSLRFRRHKLASASVLFLLMLYVVAAIAEFFAPYASDYQNLHYLYAPPSRIAWSWEKGLYAAGVEQRIDPVELRKYYVPTSDHDVPLGFFVAGAPYRLLGLIPCQTHFFGAKKTASSDQVFYLAGADRFGRDIFSRTLYGARISLSVGLAGITISLLLGVLIGGISGYCSGRTDMVIQRVIEVVNSFPQLPMWMALGVAMPPDWSPLITYFCITIVLSLFSWTSLARVVRGKILSLREEDYAVAARLLGASHSRILLRHLLPGFTSHIVVSITLTIPAMILGETSLSFLGLGLRPPLVSWGVMLQDCMDVKAVVVYPWLLAPVTLLMLTVLCFNFLGDGLRDAADPYAAR